MALINTPQIRWKFELNIATLLAICLASFSGLGVAYKVIDRLDEHERRLTKVENVMFTLPSDIADIKRTVSDVKETLNHDRDVRDAERLRHQ